MEEKQLFGMIIDGFEGSYKGGVVRRSFGLISIAIEYTVQRYQGKSRRPRVVCPAFPCKYVSSLPSERIKLAGQRDGQLVCLIGSLIEHPPSTWRHGDLML